MAFTQWWSFTDQLVDMDQNQAGVYEFGNSSNDVVYIGSTNDMKRRLKEHLGEGTTSCIKQNAKVYRIEYTSSYLTRERELIDEFIRTYGRLPRCNSVRP
ncbi:GIY-YIG nuclease family protein [Candidatus Binatus sp.]|uniref:GIY-YIG nuclease family protein n=1 Tax=Candidatus Binatus sp. TaxID=2811406 RepID=UPI003C3A628D